jgi:hypothetical protein
MMPEGKATMEWWETLSPQEKREVEKQLDEVVKHQRVNDLLDVEFELRKKKHRMTLKRQGGHIWFSYGGGVPGS